MIALVVVLAVLAIIGWGLYFEQVRATDKLHESWMETSKEIHAIYTRDTTP